MPGVRRPRVPQELAERIDAVRGLVPFEVWVREALEQALGASHDPVVMPADEVLSAPVRASETLERVQGSQRPGRAPGSSPAPPASARAPARSFVKRVDPNALARQDLLNKR